MKPKLMPVRENLGFRPPGLGELYVNSGTDRLCWVYGWEAPHAGMDRHRRVMIQYLDNGRKTKVHLYRWDLRDWHGTYPRMVRVRPDIRIINFKRPYGFWDPRRMVGLLPAPVPSKVVLGPPRGPGCQAHQPGR